MASHDGPLPTLNSGRDIADGVTFGLPCAVVITALGVESEVVRDQLARAPGRHS